MQYIITNTLICFYARNIWGYYYNTDNFEIIAGHIQERSLQYKVLLAIEDRYHGRNMVLCLAHIMNMGGI